MPYWRLSNFYLLYFAALGTLLPYWGLYLKHLGFSAVEIGELMAVILATKLVAPNIWAWVADHTERHVGVVQVTSLLAAITFVGTFFVTEFWPLVGVMVLFTFCWNAALPQIEAATLAWLGDDSHKYSRIRLWGSVGFILMSAGLGPLFDLWGIVYILPVLLLIYTTIWVSSLTLKEAPRFEHAEEEQGIAAIVRRPEVIAFFVVCFLMQAGHGVYYTFYSVYLESNGYSRSLIGILWAFGVLAEVGVFWVMHHLLARYSLYQVLMFSLLVAAVRWVMIGEFVEYTSVLWLAQIGHAFTFGAFHAAAVHMVQRFFSRKTQGRGQALYSSLSFGAGGAVGALLSGNFWESIGPTNTFYFAMALSLLAMVISWYWLGRTQAR